MNAKTGKLSNRELDTLNTAWRILSRWTEVEESKEDRNEWVDRYIYDCAMNAVCGLCEFITNYED